MTDAPAGRRDFAHALAAPQSGIDGVARGWLWLGLAALTGSGVFAILLVLSRTPFVNQWLPVADFFRIALVVHVNLSVLVWFVALAGTLWSMAGSGRARALAWAALGLCTLGTASMVVSPFVEAGTPIMANYIPVIDGRLFLSGLVLFGLGGAALVLRALHDRREALTKAALCERLDSPATPAAA